MNLGDDMLLLVALAAVTVFAFVLPFALHPLPVIFLTQLGQSKCSQTRSAKESCFESVSMAGSGLHSFERSYSFEQVDETTNWTCYDGPSTPGGWKTISAESAGVAFAALLKVQKARGRLSAKDVCLHSFFGKHVGLTGPAAEWAFHPEAASTGHCQRHLDKAVFGTDLLEDGVVYDLTHPSCDKFDSGRVLLKMPAIPPHEALDEEVRETRGLLERLKATHEAEEWVEAYTQKKVQKSFETKMSKSNSCGQPRVCALRGLLLY